MHSKRNDGRVLHTTEEVEVPARPAFRTVTFEAQGSQVKATWTTVNATRVVLNPGNVDLTGRSETTFTLPAGTIAYLTCLGPGGGETRQYGSAGAPIIKSFTATPAQIQTGGESTLTWDVTDATTMTITNDRSSVSVDVTSRTSLKVTPGETTTYTLKATGAGGETKQQATVTVGSQGQPISFTLPGNVKLELVHIPAGAFLMGSPDSEKDRIGHEGPQHQVTVSQAFYMAKFETTQAQWVALMGGNPSYCQGDLNRPVEMVSYLDITRVNGFLAKLNAATSGLRPEGAVFRLPTEAEWEFAARGGTARGYRNPQNLISIAYLIAGKLDLNNPLASRPLPT